MWHAFVSLYFVFYRWLEHVRQTLDRDDTDDLHGKEILSWAAYHANLATSDISNGRGAAITSLLPLFHHEALSAAMIQHSMDVVKKAVEVLNPMELSRQPWGGSFYYHDGRPTH